MGFQMPFGIYFVVVFSLAMTSTAIAMIVGSAVDNPQVAMEFLPITFIPQILFAGFFIAPELIPIWLRWLQYLMPLTYSVKIAVEAEFGGGCGGSDSAINYCEQLLVTTNVNPDDVWWYWLSLLALFVSFRSLAFVLLKRKADKSKKSPKLRLPPIATRTRSLLANVLQR